MFGVIITIVVYSNAVCRKYGSTVTEGVTLSGVRKDEDCKWIRTLETPGNGGRRGKREGVNLSGKRTKFMLSF